MLFINLIILVTLLYISAFVSFSDTTTEKLPPVPKTQLKDKNPLDIVGNHFPIPHVHFVACVLF